MPNNEDDDKLTSSSDDDDDDDEDDESTSSSSTATSTDDDQADEESDDNLTTSENKLAPKEAFALLQSKRNSITKRLLELRDELKAQPQADIEVKKRLLTMIKSLKEKWIAIQTRMTNLKARFSHSPTPERRTAPQNEKPTKPVESERNSEEKHNRRSRDRVVSSRSASSRSRSSSSNESQKSNEKEYQDLDALEEDKDNANDTRASRQTTSYRDLDDDFVFSPTPSPEAQSFVDENIEGLSQIDRLTLNEQIMEKLGNTETDAVAKETFYNQIIPYPIVNDKQDSEILSRQIKNQLRMLEANRNSASFSQSSNLLNYERLKKQNDFINLRMRIERLKKAKAKTQREREQNKKQFLHLVQEFRKLQRFMRSANREATSLQPVLSTIPMPKSPSPEKIVQREEIQYERFDFNRVTGKKTLFESSDSEEDEEPRTEIEVPVQSSISEPSTVPEQLGYIPIPAPPNSSSLSTIEAIKTRFGNIMNSNNSISTSTQTESTKKGKGLNQNHDDDDDDDDDNNQQRTKSSGTILVPIQAKFNRKRRKNKRNRHKKKQNNNQTGQQSMNENEENQVDQQEQWRRYLAMQLQSRLQNPNPVLRALTAEAQKKLGFTPEDLGDLPYDGEMMDYQTALILQQQEEFLAAAAANPFNILHNAAVGSAASRPNLVDILSTLNGGISSSSSSEQQTAMSLLQKFFLDARNQQSSDDLRVNDSSTTPPTPPTELDISVGKRIVESLTNKDIKALLKLSGSEHDDEDDEDEDNLKNANDENHLSSDNDSDTASSVSLFDDDLNETQNGNNKINDRWERMSNVPLRLNQVSAANNKKSTAETLILPSFNRCTHLGRLTKRSVAVERMFPSFSKHNAGPSSTLSVLLYGISSNP